MDFLDARNNQLTALPPEIGQLSRLRELFLENNHLHYVSFIIDLRYMYCIFSNYSFEANVVLNTIKKQTNELLDFHQYLASSLPVFFVLTGILCTYERRLLWIGAMKLLYLYTI